MGAHAPLCGSPAAELVVLRRSNMRAISVFALLMLPVAAWSQSSDQLFRAETDSLYAVGLGACTEAQSAAYAEINSYWADSTAAVFIEEDRRTFHTLPTMLGTRPVEVLDRSEIERLVESDGGISLVLALPIRVRGRLLEIAFSDYSVEAIDHSDSLSYALSGGCIARFEFDGESFSLIGTRLWGV